MININRHNYEEFFLLYTDRELSPAENMAVEQFIQDNPDLADEFFALQQTTLPQEALLMDKSSLYRNAGLEIGLHNHTEQFLLYVDEELTPFEREAVETFVLQHPEVQENFVQLKQTKLPAEHLLFPDKNSLYRTASDRKPVVYMQMHWMRMVAAAAVIGFAFFLWTITSDSAPNMVDNNQLASINNNKPVPENNTSSSTIVETSEKVVKENLSGVNHQVNANNQQLAATTELQQMAAVNIPTINTREELKTQPELIIERQSTITSEEPVKTAMGTAAVTGRAANAAIGESEMIKPVVPEQTPEKEALVQQVVYKELDTETDGNNKSLLIGSVEINKDKLRGLFRKATSIFRSKKSEEAETTGTGPSRPLK